MRDEPGEGLTRASLAALGAERLAELLLDEAARDERLWQRLELAVATRGPQGGLAGTLRRAIAAFAAGGHFMGYRGSFDRAEELEQLRRTIADQVLPQEPRAAAELLEAFLHLDEPVYGHCDDSSGVVGEVFRQAVKDWGRAWARVKDRDPLALADQVFGLFRENRYGVHDGVIPACGRALGRKGLGRLEERLHEAWEAEGARGEDGKYRALSLSLGLREIADLRRDVDGYIEAVRLGGAEDPWVLEIAERLLGAGRAEEALGRLDAARVPRHRYGASADLKVRALLALGRDGEAQALRWEAFGETLSTQPFRDYQAGLPPEEREEAEARARQAAREHPDVLEALGFLLDLPDLPAAADLVLSRSADLSGDAYMELRDTARALEADHPLAAVVLYRKLAEAPLDRAQSRAYAHALRDLGRSGEVARRVADWRGEPTQEAYLAALRERHGLKRAFWSRWDAGGR
ncbi:MAG: hypothetical protein P1P84_23765 [Deferrisomatales bacterium]|nr:hypothetical protein [Deferrisomatales bacterium]